MKKKQFVIIWIILALGMVLGSFVDLPLSLKLYDESNRLGIFMNFMAMVPSFILLEICCCVSSWEPAREGLIYSLSKYLLSTYYVLDVRVGAGETMINRKCIF